MTKQEIQDAYWIDFLIWYGEQEEDTVKYYGENSFILTAIEDLFWYWFTRIYIGIKQNSSIKFLDTLRGKS